MSTPLTAYGAVRHALANLVMAVGQDWDLDSATLDAMLARNRFALEQISLRNEREAHLIARFILGHVGYRLPTDGPPPTEGQG